jgi:phosphoglycolate phosphatase
MAMRVILFDFDYTLVDASSGIIESANSALRRMGLAEREASAIRATIGLSLADTFSTLTGIGDAKSQERHRTLYLERAGQVMAQMTQMLPGARECLRGLEAVGFRVGIVSTKVQANIVSGLRELAVDTNFAVIIGGDERRLRSAHGPQQVAPLAASAD